MAHLLDMSNNRVNMAYHGETPWHGLGQRLTPGADLTTWQAEAGMEWEALKAPVEYTRQIVGLNGMPQSVRDVADNNFVLYRNDTGAALSMVTDRYKAVQPKTVIEFFRDLTERYGYQLETCGSLKGGARIWALANTRNAVMLPGQDKVNGYLLLSTSFDGSQPTAAQFTSIRVVCNNTLSMTEGNALAIKTRHSTEFNASDVKIKLNVGDAWVEWSEKARRLAETSVTRSQQVKLLLDAYYGLDTEEKIAAHKEADKEGKIDKFIERLAVAFASAPGSDLASARGTLWGAVNAVTYDIDHQGSGRTNESRFIAAQWGNGAAIKARIWEACNKLALAA